MSVSQFKPQMVKDGKVVEVEAHELPACSCSFCGCLWKGPGAELSKHVQETHVKCHPWNKAL